MFAGSALDKSSKLNQYYCFSCPGSALLLLLLLFSFSSSSCCCCCLIWWKLFETKQARLSLTLRILNPMQVQFEQLERAPRSCWLQNRAELGSRRWPGWEVWWSITFHIWSFHAPLCHFLSSSPPAPYNLSQGFPTVILGKCRGEYCFVSKKLTQTCLWFLCRKVGKRKETLEMQTSFLSLLLVVWHSSQFFYLLPLSTLWFF